MPEFLAVAKKLGQNVKLNLHWQVGEHPPPSSKLVLRSFSTTDQSLKLGNSTTFMVPFQLLVH